MHYAVSSSMLDGVRRLIAKGADVNIQNKKGESPLHWAAAFNKTPKLASLLVQSGADINIRDRQDRTPLHRAVQWGYNNKLVKALLQNKANACLQDNQDRVPSDYADEYRGVSDLISYKRLKAAAIKCGI